MLDLGKHSTSNVCVHACRGIPKGSKYPISEASSLVLDTITLMDLEPEVSNIG